ncbi:MAG: hypothetical protein ACYSU0_14700 [Planctomycetota bacterium]
MAKSVKARECSAPGCARDTHARGLCQMHYDKLRKRDAGFSAGGGASGRGRGGSSRVASGGGPASAGFTIPRRRAGLRIRAPSQSVCSVPGCGAPHHAKGYCKSHYSRIRRRRSAEGRAGNAQVCEIAGCSSPISQGRRCTEHLKQPTSGIRHMTKPERLGEIRSRHDLMRREIERIKQTIENEREEDG